MRLFREREGAREILIYLFVIVICNTEYDGKDGDIAHDDYGDHDEDDDERSEWEEKPKAKRRLKNESESKKCWKNWFVDWNEYVLVIRVGWDERELKRERERDREMVIFLQVYLFSSK